ncbi:MAG: winged helix-turn-helix domain-containing protein [Alteripontixanthobacter sp.]
MFDSQFPVMTAAFCRRIDTWPMVNSDSAKSGNIVEFRVQPLEYWRLFPSGGKADAGEKMILRFAEYAVDTDRFELSRNGEPVTIRARAMKILLYLLQADGRLVRKSELLAHVWNGRIVSDSALTSQIKFLRKTLDDTTRPHRILATIHGEGFRILTSIENDGGQTASLAEQRPEDESAAVDLVGTRPRLAILPFRHVGLMGEHAQLAEALPDEIITAVSRLRWIDVIARGSSFQFAAATADLSTVREKLDVQYSLSGSIELSGEKMLVTVELSDTRTDTIVWSERYNTKIGGIHELREEIVGNVVQSVDFHMPLHERKRAQLIVPERLTAWQSFHMGISNVFTFGQPDYAAAERQFERAIAIDPLFARAHAGLSHVIWWQMVQQDAEVGANARAKMAEAADNAIACDPLDPFANLVRGRAAWLERSGVEAEHWIKRAVEFCPSYSMAHAALANLRVLSDKAESAMPHVDKAISLSPIDPWLHNVFAIRAISHIGRGEFDIAADWATKASAMPHHSLIVLQCAVLALDLAGRDEEAAKIADRIRKAHPGADHLGMTRSLPLFSNNLERRSYEAFRKHGLAN